MSVRSFRVVAATIIVSAAVISVYVFAEQNMDKNRTFPVYTSVDRSGIIIPLYFDPNTTWYEIVQLHHEYPGVPMIVIVNPDNGPGSNYSQAYRNWTAEMTSSGITVLGYIYTSYGSRSASTIMGQVDQYITWYGIYGIFLDEVSDNSSDSSYYHNVTQDCRSVGITYIVGNPGTYAPENITRNFNLTVLYENSGMPEVNQLESITNGTSRNFSSIIAVGVPNLNLNWIQVASEYFSYIYVTDLGEPNPYFSLPGYIQEEMDYLSSL